MKRFYNATSFHGFQGVKASWYTHLFILHIFLCLKKFLIKRFDVNWIKVKPWLNNVIARCWITGYLDIEVFSKIHASVYIKVEHLITEHLKMVEKFYRKKFGKLTLEIIDKHCRYKGKCDYFQSTLYQKRIIFFKHNKNGCKLKLSEITSNDRFYV